MLFRAKEDVWLLDKDHERAARIARQGVKVEGLARWEVKVPITADPQKIGPVALVILCVKSYDTKEALAHARPLIAKDTLVLTLQNGMGNVEHIEEILGAETVLGGVTGMGSTALGEGNVRFAGKGETVIGRLDGTLPVQLRAVRDVLIKAGFEVKSSRDIKSALWSKLIVNVGINALSAITRLPNGKLIAHEGTRRIMRDAVTEAVKVAKRKRIKLLYDDPLAKVEGVCESTASNISSMLQDMMNAKRTEIDYLNGVIVRLGVELGIATPVNALLADCIRAMESQYAARINQINV
jgi:2-dehydropantoate 2-reductase